MYQIKNTLNNKIYIGVHKTSDMNDGYMGSGKVICAAIKKYGIKNFKKTILETFESSEEMFKREKEIVTEDFLSRRNVYNLRRGGHGGFDHINKFSEIYHQVRSDAGKKGSKKDKQRAGKITGLANKERWKTDPNSKPIVFTPEFNKEMSLRAQHPDAKEKRAQTRKEKQFQVGTNNSQYGTTWVWHELIGNKKIPKDLVPQYLDQGWFKTYKPGYRMQRLV